MTTSQGRCDTDIRGPGETGQLPLTVLSVLRPAARQTDQSQAGIYTSANERSVRGTMDQSEAAK